MTAPTDTPHVFLYSTGEDLTVVVNHFKSKGCDGSSGANADPGDGQGCWNADRVTAVGLVILGHPVPRRPMTVSTSESLRHVHI